MAERILLTFTRPKSALALLDEIIALRAERDAAIRHVLHCQRILLDCETQRDVIKAALIEALHAKELGA